MVKDEKYWLGQSAWRLNRKLKEAELPTVSAAQLKDFLGSRGNNCEACGTRSCNSGIGVAKEDVRILNCMLTYLERAPHVAR